MRLKEAADLRALLAQEQERRREAERRLAAHAARAAENNTALARNNLRLQEQLARLRGEADALAHEVGCQRAAAAAREQLAAEELGRLRARLQRCEVEQQSLRKQLAAKQGIISYLESKLELLQGRGKQPSLDAGAVASAGVECMKVAAAGAAATAGDDEAGMVSDSSSRGSLSVGDWAAAAAELEAQGPPGTIAPPAATAGGSCGSTLRSMPISSDGEGSSEGSENGEGLGQGLAAAAPAAPHLNGKARASTAGVQVAAWAGHRHEQSAEAAAAAAAAAGGVVVVTEDAVAGDTGTGGTFATPLAAAPAAAVAASAAAPLADEVTPLRRPFGQGADASLEPAGTALRSSLRPRSSGVTYLEPSLRSKLRQGDRHTFGLAEAAAARAGSSSSSSSQPRARTKPRHLFAAGSKAGAVPALQPVPD